MRLIDNWLLALERSYLRGLDVDGKLVAHLRAMQLGRLLAISPFLMIGNIINGVVVAGALLALQPSMAIGVWLVAVLGYGAVGLQTASQLNKRTVPATVSIRTIRRLLGNCVILAALWGSLPCIVFYDSGGLTSILVTAVVTGMLGGGTIALGFVPIAATVYIVVTLSLCAIALLIYGQAEALVMAPLFITYAVVLIKSANAYGRGFAQTVMSEARVREQATTIGILLREYEDAGRDWIWETDADGVITRGLEEVATVTRFDLETILATQAAVANGEGEPPGMTSQGLDDFTILSHSREFIRDHLVSIGREDGKRFWFRLNGKPVYGNDGAFTGYRGVVSNVTEETESEQHIQYLARYDSLTGLLNRSFFQEHLKQAISDSGEGYHSWAVLYLDLDGFKAINDMHGHPAGDALLERVARRISAIIGPDDIAGRLGGDEFAILTPIKGELESVIPFAGKVITEFSRPFVVDGNICQIGASIGIASAWDHGKTPGALLRAADMALYSAKQAGRGQFCLFTSEMDIQVSERLHFEDELRQAIARDQFTLSFQPFFTSPGGELAGFEALARWTHPEFGNVSPTRFIPVAEKIGIISDLGSWVLNEACSVAANWPENLSIAVNASMPQFHDGRIVSAVRDALDLSGLTSTRLEIEITEHVFADNPDEILKCMQAIKDMGVIISLDDFGTGYSSLLYLLKFPFDKLKIDRSFVTTAGENAAAREVLDMIAALGGKLGLATTAEGVETPEQLAMVEAVGCDYCQGFLLGSPISVMELAPFIMEHMRDTDNESAASENLHIA